VVREPSTHFDADAFEWLAAGEDRSFWFRARNDLILWAIRRYANHVDDVLEVGCGTGFVLQAIHRSWPLARLTGLEPFSEGLGIARQRVPTATFVEATLAELGERDAYDVVGAFDVLEHIEDDQAALDRIASALRVGGLLLATVPQHPQLWSATDVEAHHVRRYRPQELASRVRAAGLVPLRSTSFVTLLLPALLAVRGGSESVRDQMALPTAVDRLLEWVMAIERASIRAGFDLPIGGSLLVIARRPS